MRVRSREDLLSDGWVVTLEDELTATFENPETDVFVTVDKATWTAVDGSYK